MMQMLNKTQLYPMSAHDSTTCKLTLESGYLGALSTSHLSASFNVAYFMLRRARYCSETCQWKDWKAHKAICRKAEACGGDNYRTSIDEEFA